MKSVKSSKLMVIVFLIVGISMFLGYPGMAPAQKQPAVTNEDCVKCHVGPPADIAAAGGKHAGAGCSGCHVGHPPAAPLLKAPASGRPTVGLTGMTNRVSDLLEIFL